MLREEDVPRTHACHERDRSFRFRYVRCEVPQEFGFDVFEKAVNHAKAIGVRRGFAYSLRRFDFRDTFEKRTRSLEICIALGECALRGCNHLFWSTTQFFRRRAKTEKILPRDAFGSRATHKFHAPILAHFRATPHQQRSNLASGFDVRSTTTLQIS